MTIQASGTITVDDLSSEFKRQRNITSSLSEFYRNGGRVPSAPQNSRIPTAGSISLNQFYGAQNEITITPVYDGGGAVYDFNLYNEFQRLYGTPQGPVNVRLINTGFMQSSGLGYALDLGQFPVGSVIIFENRNVVFGLGGYGGGTGQNGGQGGHAIYAGHAVYAGCSVQIINTGNIVAGGGGGGGGGNGGGGFEDVPFRNSVGPSGVHPVGCDSACAASFGSNASCPFNCARLQYSGWRCNDCVVTGTNRNFTNGGIGGSGGRGQGWDVLAANGSPGSNGDVNAGNGGSGGRGGDPGQYGASGAGGSGGNNGGGTGGGSGGPPGYALDRGNNQSTVTITNVAGSQFLGLYR